MLFLFGGNSDLASELNDLYVYSIDNDHWHQVPLNSPLPAPRVLATAVAHGNVVLLYGGRIGNVGCIEPCAATDCFSNELWAYNIIENEYVGMLGRAKLADVLCSADRWIEVPSDQGRYGHTAVLAPSSPVASHGVHSYSCPPGRVSRFAVLFCC